jgi:hypothetical protein
VLRGWDRLGVRGLRFNHFFRDGQTPDQATQHSILVTNPAKLYGFPN